MEPLAAKRNKQTWPKESILNTLLGISRIERDQCILAGPQ